MNLLLFDKAIRTKNLVNFKTSVTLRKKVLWNPFLASGDLCRLLVVFANSLDPDQDQQNVSPDLDPNCLTLWQCF